MEQNIREFTKSERGCESKNSRLWKPDSAAATESPIPGPFQFGLDSKTWAPSQRDQEKEAVDENPSAYFLPDDLVSMLSAHQ